MMSDTNLEPLDEAEPPRIRLEGGTKRSLPVFHPSADASTMGREVHLTDYIKILYKRRYTAAAVFLLIVGSVAVYTFTATPLFEARTRILIEVVNPSVVSFKEVIDENQTKSDYYQTQYNILQSRALARRTMDELKLWTVASVRTPGGTKAPSAWDKLLGFFGRGAASQEVQSVAADESAEQSRGIDAFLSHLTITPIRTSRLVDIRYTLPDRKLATDIVNSIAKNYIEQNLEYKFLASKEANEWLSQRLKEQREQVETAEVKLQQYREQNDAIALADRQNITVQKLADLNATLTRAKTERIQKEAIYNQLVQSQSNPAMLDSFPAILSNSFIQQQKTELSDLQRQYSQMSEKLGDKHPEIIRLKAALQISQAKLSGEIGKVVQSVKSEYQSSLAQEASLTSALNAQKSEALSMNRKGIEYGVLERDMQSSKQIYESLMQRAKETGVSGELKSSNIRIVDPAEVPRSPVSPRRQLNMTLALLTGTVLALGLTFFLEYLDNRIKTPDELKSHLGLAFLGLIPKVADKSGQSAPLLTDGAPGSFVEAFRTLRTNVLFSSAQSGAKTVVITSTGPGEGKSVVASNLAVALAQSGQRVLLIDADLRRPQLHIRFGQKEEPGLSNLMVGNAKASEVVRKTAIHGLWLLAAGRVPPNPAELLGSARFRDFIATLKDHFDCIVVDTPPVLAVTDAALVANVASGVIFVVGAEMASRYAARAAIETLVAAKAQFFGGVLNKVDLEHNAYYYSQYYRKEYSHYYAKTS
jgi:succinoglycan biosynthesis transport protein ExoP